MSETETQPTSSRASKAANLFDLRRIIGGVFVGYGVLLTILGLFDSQKEIDKAAGVNINLWAGLGMLAFGILMFAWALSRPLSEDLDEGEPASDEPSGRPGVDDERPVGSDDARRQ
jgi:hypothetical protein